MKKNASTPPAKSLKDAVKVPGARLASNKNQSLKAAIKVPAARLAGNRNTRLK